MYSPVLLIVPPPSACHETATALPSAAVAANCWVVPTASAAVVGASRTVVSVTWSNVAVLSEPSRWLVTARPA